MDQEREEKFKRGLHIELSPEQVEDLKRRIAVHNQPDATTNMEICYECGRQLPITEMIRFEEIYFCADCKEMFAQRVRENSWPRCPACSTRLKQSILPGQACTFCGTVQRSMASAIAVVLLILATALTLILILLGRSIFD